MGRRCSVLGMCGAALMFAGDVALYGPSAYGLSAADYFDKVDPVGGSVAGLLASPMGESGAGRASVGGWCGPVAAALYIAACHGLFLHCSEGSPRAGWAAYGGFGAAFVAVAVYHGAFPYTAFIAGAGLSGAAGAKLVEAHSAYIAGLKALIKVLALVGTGGLAGLCFGERPPASGAGAALTLWPRWMLCFAPSLWLMAVRETGLLRRLPAPLGLILAGGSFNIAFFAFFGLVALRSVAVRRAGAGSKAKQP